MCTSLTDFEKLRVGDEDDDEDSYHEDQDEESYKKVKNFDHECSDSNVIRTGVPESLQAFVSEVEIHIGESVKNRPDSP